MLANGTASGKPKAVRTTVVRCILIYGISGIHVPVFIEVHVFETS